MKYSTPSAFIVVALLLLAGCAGTLNSACDRTYSVKRKTGSSNQQICNRKKAASEKSADWRPDSYIVKKGDTLYAIGLEYGFDYKDIARWNEITAPTYTIKVGQALKLKAPAGIESSPVVAAAAAAAPASATPEGTVVSAIKTEAAPQPKPLDEPVSAAAEAKADVTKPVEKTVDDNAVEWGWPAVGKS